MTIFQRYKGNIIFYMSMIFIKSLKDIEDHSALLFSLNHPQIPTPSHRQKLLKISKNVKIHSTTSYSSVKVVKM